MQNTLSYSSQTPIFSKFSPIFPAFCSLLLASYFSKNFAGKIGAALAVCTSSNVIIKKYQEIFVILPDNGANLEGKKNKVVAYACRYSSESV